MTAPPNPTDRDVPDVTGMLCFSLYSAGHAFTQLYRPLLEKLGLTYPQYLVMVTLWSRDGRTVKELGQTLFLDSSTLTPLLKRLEALGLINRRRNPANERQLVVSLTQAGRALQEKARPIPEAFLCASGRDMADLLRLRDEMAGIRESFAASRQSAPRPRPEGSTPDPSDGT